MSLLPRFFRYKFDGVACSDSIDLRGEVISRRTRIVLPPDRVVPVQFEHAGRQIGVARLERNIHGLRVQEGWITLNDSNRHDCDALAWIRAGAVHALSIGFDTRMDEDPLPRTTRWIRVTELSLCRHPCDALAKISNLIPIL